MRAFDLRVRALAPRRSHSISECTRFSSASCRFDCACRNSSFFSRNVAVAPLHPQYAIGINAAQFRHVGGDVLQKVAIVADHHAGETQPAPALLPATRCRPGRDDSSAHRAAGCRAPAPAPRRSPAASAILQRAPPLRRPGRQSPRVPASRQSACRAPTRAPPTFSAPHRPRTAPSPLARTPTPAPRSSGAAVCGRRSPRRPCLRSPQESAAAWTCPTRSARSARCGLPQKR